MPFTSTPRDVPAARRWHVWRRTILWAVLLLWGATAWWQTNKAMPVGTHVAKLWPTASSVSFLSDISWADAYGRHSASQSIFDEAQAILFSARRFVVLDFHQFSAAYTNSEAVQLRPLAAELRDSLIERRRQLPDLAVLLITDPASERWGDLSSYDLRLLRAAGVQVVISNVDRLRDSNFLYSSLWRWTIRWWNDSGSARQQQPGGGLAPLSFGASARQLNFKADHRKVLIADDGHDGLVGLVGSMEPTDANSADSNAALKVSGMALSALLQSELDTARFSGWRGRLEVPPPIALGLACTDIETSACVETLTEGAIRAALLEKFDATGSDGHIDLSALYLSDRGVIESLLAAAGRGVAVRILLDPNRDDEDSGGDGVPNQPVASELVAKSDGAIHVRWYRTHGERYNSSLAMVWGQGKLWLTTGSANFTRRSLADYNLEANFAVQVSDSSHLAKQLSTYFDNLWSNRAKPGIEYSADFGSYSDPSQLHYWLYRVMEGSGFCSF